MLPVEKDDFYTKPKVYEKEFWGTWGAKLMTTLISVKVWGLIAGTTVSTALVIDGRISNVHWVTFNTTIWGLIFGMKEVFKISESREKTDNRMAEQQLQAEEKRIVLAQKSKDASATYYTPEGLEIVGAEPDG